MSTTYCDEICMGMRQSVSSTGMAMASSLNI
jgi:hypothetical protein